MKIQIRQNLANFITLANAFCGGLAVIAIQEGGLLKACFWLLLGLFFDFFDGLVARWLRIQSPLGVQLDSLADAITFGLVPSLILYHYWEKSHSLSASLSFLFLLSAVWRLAQFNLDNRQRAGIFIGLPTPAAALAIIALPLMEWQSPSLMVDLLFPLTVGLCLSLTLLMQAPLNLLSFKFKNLTWSTNWQRYIVIIGSLILLLTFQFFALLPILFLYLLVSWFSQK